MKNIISKILKFFTLNKMVKNKDVKILLINIAIYIGIGIALGIYKAIVGRIPLLGNLSYNVAGLYKIYAWVGAILAAIQCFSNDDYSDVEYVTLEDIKNFWNLKNGKIAIIVAAVVLCLIPNINRALIVGSNDKKEDKVASSEVKEMEEDKQEEYSDKEVEEAAFDNEYDIEEKQEEVSAPVIKSEMIKEMLGGDAISDTDILNGIKYFIYPNGMAVAVVVDDVYTLEEDAMGAPVIMVACNDAQYYVGNDSWLLGDVVSTYSELYDIDGMDYGLYEKGAWCSIIDEDYKVKDTIDFEGNTYTVIEFLGCDQYRTYKCDEFTIPQNIKIVTTLKGIRANNIVIPESTELLNLTQPFRESSFNSIALSENITYKMLLDSNKLVCNGTYWECNGISNITIPEGIQVLDKTFYKCSSLESVTLPNTIAEIKECSFEGCRNLTEITLPENVKIIEHYAFKDCNSLTSINLPEGMTELSLYAFENCTSLEEIIIPEGLEVFLGGFYNMPSLKTVVFPKEGEYSVDVFVESNSPVETIYLPDSTTVDRIQFGFPDTLKTLYVAEDKVSEFQAAYPDVEILVRE